MTMPIPASPPDGQLPANTKRGVPIAADERQRLMNDLGITYNGRSYAYGRYRYGSLADAVNYARLRRGDPRASDDAGSMPPPEHVESPDERQRQRMAELDIAFKDGVYRLGEFRYDRLADAIDYALRQRGGPRR